MCPENALYIYLTSIRSFCFLFELGVGKLLYNDDDDTVPGVLAGPLIKDIREHLKQKSNEELPKAKVYMYSGHDTTVTMLLRGLGVFNNMSPPYATTVLIELRNVSNQYFVEVC